jgi:hypothetical protein
MANAVNFVTFCKDPSVQAMTVTWDELDCIYAEPSLQNETPPFHIPDLASDNFRNILQGHGDPESAKSHFPTEFYNFINECYAPPHLRRLSDEDINIFLTKAAKPQVTQEEIIWNLLDWLRDLHEAFSPSSLTYSLPTTPGISISSFFLEKNLVIIKTDHSPPKN